MSRCELKCKNLATARCLFAVKDRCATVGAIFIPCRIFQARLCGSFSGYSRKNLEEIELVPTAGTL